MYLIDQIKERDTTDRQRESMHIQHAWTIADRDTSGGLDINEVKKSLNSLNIEANEELIRKIFDEIDVDQNGMIDQIEFDSLMDLLFIKPELEDLYMRFTELIDDVLGISRSSFFKFLSETQDMENVSTTEANKVFQKYAEQTASGNYFISKKGFRLYMFSPNENHIFSQEKFELFMDMTQPLPNYYIDSSHNTYLEGNQLTGNSSVEQYTKTLFRGCRCVEIDIWDGPNGNPKVTHGHTLVSNIDFRSVCEAINQSSFTSSPYPVVLSLENHCSFEQQGVMAEIFIDVFGDQIYIPPPNATSFPSPEQLKYKILIKGKMTAHTVEAEEDVSDEDVSDEDPQKTKRTSPKPKQDKVNPKLIALLAIEGSKMQVGDRPYKQMSSVTESGMLKLVAKHGFKTMIEYHKKNLTRIYPANSRINSSNMNPVNYWLSGCQIVALNYQKSDLGMLLNYGWFQSNGGCGYILKPSIMTDSNTLFDPNGPGMDSPLFNFDIEIISAQGLPKSGKELGQIVNPFIEIQIHGIEKDKATACTKVVQNNGFNPVWNEKFTFPIRMMEICMVTFRVYSKSVFKNHLLCQYSIPISCVRNGFRVLPLLGKNFFILSNTFLLVDVRMNPIFSN